jgi:5'-nucleotidase / UDP-sugar diphosphatase
MKMIQRVLTRLWLVMAFVAVVIAGSDRPLSADGLSLHLFYGNDVAAYLDPSCLGIEGAEQIGGLYRRTGYIREYRKTNVGVVVVDSGDLFFEDDNFPDAAQDEARRKAELVGRIYQRIGCDALNVGERDLILGIDFLKNLEKKLGLPFVSANLTDAANNYLFPRYIIKEVEGKRVGIFGLLGNTIEISSKSRETAVQSLVVQDPLTSAEEVVKKLKGKADLIIAVTHQGVGRDWILAKKIEGIDIIIGGHDKQRIQDPYEVGKTWITQSGEKGQYLGCLQITDGADGVKSVRNTLIPLGKQIQNDDEVKSMISEYHKGVSPKVKP